MIKLATVSNKVVVFNANALYRTFRQSANSEIIVNQIFISEYDPATDLEALHFSFDNFDVAGSGLTATNLSDLLTEIQDTFLTAGTPPIPPTDPFVTMLFDATEVERIKTRMGVYDVADKQYYVVGDAGWNNSPNELQRIEAKVTTYLGNNNSTNYISERYVMNSDSPVDTNTPKPQFINGVMYCGTLGYMKNDSTMKSRAITELVWAAQNSNLILSNTTKYPYSKLNAEPLNDISAYFCRYAEAYEYVRADCTAQQKEIIENWMFRKLWWCVNAFTERMELLWAVVGGVNTRYNFTYQPSSFFTSNNLSANNTNQYFYNSDFMTAIMLRYSNRHLLSCQAMFRLANLLIEENNVNPTTLAMSGINSVSDVETYIRNGIVQTYQYIKDFFIIGVKNNRLPDSYRWSDNGNQTGDHEQGREYNCGIIWSMGMIGRINRNMQSRIETAFPDLWEDIGLFETTLGFFGSEGDGQTKSLLEVCIYDSQFVTDPTASPKYGTADAGKLNINFLLDTYYPATNEYSTRDGFYLPFLKFWLASNNAGIVAKANNLKSAVLRDSTVYPNVVDFPVSADRKNNPRGLPGDGHFATGCLNYPVFITD